MFSKLCILLVSNVSALEIIVLYQVVQSVEVVRYILSNGKVLDGFFKEIFTSDIKDDVIAEPESKKILNNSPDGITEPLNGIPALDDTTVVGYLPVESTI